MTPFVHSLRVRYVECDMQNRVFNAHFVTWMDMAHTAFIQERVASIPELMELGVDFVVAEVGVRFLGAARFDEDIDIEVALDPLGTTSMTSRHTMRRGEDVLAEGWVRHVCVDGQTYAKRPWPDLVRSAVTA